MGRRRWRQAHHRRRLARAHGRDIVVPGDLVGGLRRRGGRHPAGQRRDGRQELATPPGRLYEDAAGERGADHRQVPVLMLGGQPVADLRSLGGELYASRRRRSGRRRCAPTGDPILAVAAACARGTTRMLGRARASVTKATGGQQGRRSLAANGVRHEMGADTLSPCTARRRSAAGRRRLRHPDRIAMSFLVLGLASRATAWQSTTARRSTPASRLRPGRPAPSAEDRRRDQKAGHHHRRQGRQGTLRARWPTIPPADLNTGLLYGWSC